MRPTYLWAIGIAVLLLAWLASGQLNQAPVVFDPSIAERNEQDLNQRGPVWRKVEAHSRALHTLLSTAKREVG